MEEQVKKGTLRKKQPKKPKVPYSHKCKRVSKKEVRRATQDKILKNEPIFSIYLKLLDDDYTEAKAEEIILDALENIHSLRAKTNKYMSSLSIEKLEGMAKTAFEYGKMKEAVAAITAITDIASNNLEDNRETVDAGEIVIDLFKAAEQPKLGDKKKGVKDE